MLNLVLDLVALPGYWGSKLTSCLIDVMNDDEKLDELSGKGSEVASSLIGARGSGERERRRNSSLSS